MTEEEKKKQEKEQKEKEEREALEKKGFVPSGRLREESEAKRKETERANNAEAELKRLKEAQSKDDGPKAPKTSEEYRQMLKDDLKPDYNADSGEYEFSDKAIDTLIGLVGGMVRSGTKSITTRMANQEVREQKYAIQKKPHFKELEPEIDKALAKLTNERLMQPGIVEKIFNYLRGAKFEELVKKEVPRAEDHDPGEIIEDVTPGPAHGKDKVEDKKLPKMTPAQKDEYEKYWKSKGYDEADYFDLLNRAKEQDKKRGLKVERETLRETVSS